MFTLCSLVLEHLLDFQLITLTSCLIFSGLWIHNKNCSHCRDSQQSRPEPQERSTLFPCIEFDAKMQQDLSLALESAEVCGAVLSECQQALDASLHCLPRFSHAADVSVDSQVLAARHLMFEIEALEDAWSKARKSADRAGEVSFELSDLVKALRKENDTLQEQVHTAQHPLPVLDYYKR